MLSIRGLVGSGSHLAGRPALPEESLSASAGKTALQVVDDLEIHTPSRSGSSDLAALGSRRLLVNGDFGGSISPSLLSPGDSLPIVSNELARFPLK